MSKKLTIIGKGSVGSLAVMQFLKNTDWDIDWVFDENIAVASVGEASNLLLTSMLSHNGFDQRFVRKIGGTSKIGILKENWSWKDNFLHPFLVNSVAMHFSASDLHQALKEQIITNPRVKIINKNIDNPETIDSDFVLVCSGMPKKLNSGEYEVIEEIPVNAVYVVQCKWEYPHFNYSLTNAMQYGWVFGIPLQDRISIGYLYNDEINDLEEIKEDIKKVFQQYNLNPSDKTNHLEFQSYYKKNNFSPKVIYNGNASFFIEPLEATSIGLSIENTREAIKYWKEKPSDESIKSFQNYYSKSISDISAMISLHYLAGSKYNTEFWKYAQFKATEKIKKEFENETEWSKFVWSIIINKEVSQGEIGTWGDWNYRINIEGLGIKDKLIQIRNSTKSISLNKEGK